MTINLDFRHAKPEFKRPELLKHPPIPERLFFINPRTLEGDDWWDDVRHRAYLKNNECCWACGRHKSRDDFHQWLEAHESYEYTSKPECVARLSEIVALCPTCHYYIHIGNTYRRLRRAQLSPRQFKKIILHGTNVLRKAGLEPNYEAYLIATQTFESKRLREWRLRPSIEEVQRFVDFDLCNSFWKFEYKGKYYWNDVWRRMQEEDIDAETGSVEH